MSTSYLAGLVSFVMFVLIFLLGLRTRFKSGWFLLEIVLGIIVHVIASLVGFFTVENFSYWYQASLYAFLWFCFFFVTSIYSASVSIGIISYLYDRPQRTATLAEVYQNCVTNVFERRVDFLIAQGQAKNTAQGYVATSQGRKTVHRIEWINQILGMQSQGFYSTKPAEWERQTPSSP